MTAIQTISLDSLSDLRLNKQERTLTLEFIANPVSHESSVRRVGRYLIVTRNGKEMSLVNAVRQEFNIPEAVTTTQSPLAGPFQCIKSRVEKGMSFDEAVKDYRNRGLRVDYKGEPTQLAHAIKDYLGVDQSVSKAKYPSLKSVYEGIKGRIHRGMSFDEAIADYSIRNSATIERAKRECGVG